MLKTELQRRVEVVVLHENVSAAAARLAEAEEAASEEATQNYHRQLRSPPREQRKSSQRGIRSSPGVGGSGKGAGSRSNYDILSPGSPGNSPGTGNPAVIAAKAALDAASLASRNAREGFMHRGVRTYDIVAQANKLTKVACISAERWREVSKHAVERDL